MFLRFSLAVLALMSLAAAGAAQCDLAITSFKTVDANGLAHTPKLGEPYFVRVDWKVTGHPTSTYDVKVEIANFSATLNITDLSAGNYYAYWGWNLPLDGKFPAKATLDVNNVEPDSDRSNNTATRQVRPQLPAQAFSWYDPQTLYSSHTSTVQLGSTSNWSRLLILSAVPTTEGFQTVIKHQVLSGSLVTTQPTGYPGLWLDVTNPAAGGTFQTKQKMTIKVKNSKMNVNKVKDTWDDFTNLPTDVQHWLQPEAMIESDSPEVAAFVDRVMPSNFKNKQNPIKAARTLFLAVVKELDYVTTATFDVVTVLNNKYTDCGGFTSLYVASLRHIGIPARMRSGYLTGTNNWHVWPEIYMPSVGWIAQDPTFSDGYDPDGTYPYFFANMSDLNTRCAVGIGNTFTEPSTGLTADIFQSFYYWGWWFNRGADVASSDVILSPTPIP